MRYLSVFLFTLLLGSFAQAQQPLATLRGRVTTPDGQPAEFASVGLRGTRIGATTDANGAFSLQAPAGRYLLLISSVGAELIEKQVAVKAGTETALGTFVLRASDTQLAEVVVRGKTEARTLVETGLQVSAIEMKKFENQTVNVDQVLNRTTGIRIRQTAGLGSDFNFSLNGLSGKQVKFLIDGVPMENFGDSFGINNIPANAIQRVEVYKGVVPVGLNTDALGGAVNIVTNNRLFNFLDASHSYGSFNTHRANLSGQYVQPKTGLVLRANGFFNYSDNDYRMKQVEVLRDERFVLGDVRRFHDRYVNAAGRVEVGLIGKKWADRFFVGVQMARTNRQIQTGGSVESVVGDAVNLEKNLISTLTYQKDKLLGLPLKLNASLLYNRTQRDVVDTSSNRYDWSGQVVSYHFSTGELNDEKRHFDFRQRELLASATAVYALAPHHSLTASHLTSVSRRGMENIFGQEPGYRSPDRDLLRNPELVRKQITGLGYEGNFIDDKLLLSGGLKHYAFRTFTPNAIVWDETVFDYVRTESANTLNNWGYLAAVRYRLTPRVLAKASFERSFRLPDVNELFGDGIFVVANPELQPEKSFNYNAGVQATLPVGRKNTFTVEVGGFYRDVEDLIYQVGRTIRQNRNLTAGRMRGLEAELTYRRSRWLQLTANLTYQDIRNHERLIPNTDVESVFYKDRIPNIPYLFGNAEVLVTPEKTAFKNWKPSFYWNLAYIQNFFLQFPRLGRPDLKDKIPTQFIQNAGVTFSTLDNRYNLSLECNNLFDQLAFDNFRLQKPTRAFFVKLRYYLSK